MDGIVLRDARRGGMISAEEMTAMRRAERAGRLVAGPGIRVTRTPTGTVVSAVRPPKSVLRARVSDAVAGTVGTDYGGGTFMVSTDGGTYVADVAELSLIGSLPEGSRVIVHPVLCRLVGGD